METMFNDDADEDVDNAAAALDVGMWTVSIVWHCW